MSRKTILHALFCACCLLPVQAVSNQIFINEFHYDNIGADVNESVELAGTAGSSLDDWQLVFYNGSNGNPYNTLLLTGHFKDVVNGFGFLSFAMPGIQNGSPDGIALVTPELQVSEFISYEGVVNALSGPVAGQASVDIGLHQSSTAPVNHSLYLTGSGSQRDDFIWAAGNATFGRQNEAQRFGTSLVNPSEVPVPGVLALMILPLILLGRMSVRIKPV